MTDPTKGSLERLPTRARGALAKRDMGGLVTRALADWKRLQSARTSSAAKAEASDEERYRQAKGAHSRFPGAVCKAKMDCEAGGG